MLGCVAGCALFPESLPGQPVAAAGNRALRRAQRGSDRLASELRDVPAELCAHRRPPALFCLRFSPGTAAGLPPACAATCANSLFHSCPCPNFCQELPWLPHHPDPQPSFASDIGRRQAFFFLRGVGRVRSKVLKLTVFIGHYLPECRSHSAVSFRPPQNLPRGRRARGTRAELLHPESPVLSCVSPRAPA